MGVSEAKLKVTPEGLVPEGEGWFIVNAADARGMRHEHFGQAVRFEGEAEFPAFGVNVRRLEPGQPNCYYHRESNPEAFLVLDGECVAIVEEEERRMRKGDFLYAPPGTAHVIVGAGDGPCAILMVGARDEGEKLEYPVSDIARRHGAGVDKETDFAAEAYAALPRPEPAQLRLSW
jgi:uncharacterized cupin superfamily protein